MPSPKKVTPKQTRKREQIRTLLLKIKEKSREIDELVDVCESLVFGEKKTTGVQKRRIQNVHQKKERDKFLEKQQRIESANSISPEVTMLLENWESFAKVGKVGTITRDKDIKTLKAVLAGSFFSRKEDYKEEYKGKKFSVSDVIKVFHKFDLMRNNSKYKPVDKKWTKSIHISSFFWNEYNPVDKSLFIKLLTTEPVYVKDDIVLSEEEQSAMNIICKRYNKIKRENHDPEQFIKSATLMVQFYNKNEKKFKHTHSISKLCVCLFSLLEQQHASGWEIGHISTDFAFTRLQKDMINKHLLGK